MPKTLRIVATKKDHTEQILIELGMLRDGSMVKKDRWRTLAYSKAIGAIEMLGEPIYSVSDVEGVSNIGSSTLEHISQVISNGTSTKAEEYRKDPHIGIILELIHINGVGPVAANRLVKDNGIKTIKELVDRQDELLTSRQKIGLSHYRDTIIRIPRYEMVKHQKFLDNLVLGMSNITITIAGSYRRNSKDSGDIDVLIRDDMGEGPKILSQFLDRLRSLQYLINDIAVGETKYNGFCRLPTSRMDVSRRIDIMYTTTKQYPFALLYFTGSGSFNQEMRGYLSKKGFKLNEYGLKRNVGSIWSDVDTASITKEEQIFQLLKIPYINPEKRSRETLISVLGKKVCALTIKESITKQTITPKKKIVTLTIKGTTPKQSLPINNAVCENFSPLLAGKWNPESLDPKGWWASEKLDGVRAIWNGVSLNSRLGNEFPAPQWFLDKLPKHHGILLDGELFTGRGNFQDTVSIVRNSNLHDDWENVVFQVFDYPSCSGVFEERMLGLKKLLQQKKSKYIKMLEHIKVENSGEVLSIHTRIDSLGGEGVMLRKPKSLYVNGRSNTLLKVKSFYDAEAKVISHAPGSGRHLGRMGSLNCIMECGKKFRVGTGFTDANRNDPPPINSIITYRFQELTKSGVPRFPSYVGVRVDKLDACDYKF